MSVITVPVSPEQNSFIQGMVKSGRAANKAHAVRMGIQLLAEEEALRRLARAEDDIAAGSGMRGDLRELAAHLD